MREGSALLSNRHSSSAQPDGAKYLHAEDSLGFSCRVQCGDLGGKLAITAEGDFNYVPEQVARSQAHVAGGLLEHAHVNGAIIADLAEIGGDSAKAKELLR